MYIYSNLDIPSGNVGLAILSSINLVGLCQWGMRQTAELENQMISVERIMEYAELPPEPPLESDEKHRPPVDWPNSGAISFKLLSMRYAEKSNRTLRNLTFHIEPQVGQNSQITKRSSQAPKARNIFQCSFVCFFFSFSFCLLGENRYRRSYRRW